MEDERMMVELMDEEGNKILFEHVTTVMHKEEEYVVLIPVGDMDEEEEDEFVVIMHLIPGEDEDELEVIEDDDLLDAVYQAFVTQIEELDEE